MFISEAVLLDLTANNALLSASTTLKALLVMLGTFIDKFPGVVALIVAGWLATPITKSPAFKVKLLFNVVAPVTSNVPPNEEAPVPTVNVFVSAILTLSFNVVAPVTVNEPPSEEAPVPTVKVFESATLTLSFNVVAPVTVNEPPSEEAPVPTVNVFASAILTLSFNVVAPATVKDD